MQKLHWSFDSVKATLRIEGIKYSILFPAESWRHFGSLPQWNGWSPASAGMKTLDTATVWILLCIVLTTHQLFLGWELRDPSVFQGIHTYPVLPFFVWSA